MTIEWRAKLCTLAKGNDEYAIFNARIVNTKMKVLGVRVLDLRKLAKQVMSALRGSDDARQLLATIDKTVFEETMLAGLVIDNMKLPSADYIALTRCYLELVDSWAQIDIFISKHAWRQNAECWHFACEMMHDPREFFVRYGVVMAMANFLDDEYIDELYQHLRQLGSDAYYVKMAAAWLYATAAVRYFDKTMNELQNPVVDSWTRRKAYQKMRESCRITSEQKMTICEMRKML